MMTQHVVGKWGARVSLFVIVVTLSVVGMNTTTLADSTQVKKVLYVASYDLTDNWGLQIKSGIESVFESRQDVELKAITMETRGMTSADTETIKKAALEAKMVIDSWKPDLVIASDDNASKYLIVPYFKDTDLPFVFCGVNADPATYGFPAKNVTGMIEVQLVDQLVKFLSPYAKGPKIGSVRGDTMTNRVEHEFFEKQIGADITVYYVDNITDWKTRFVQLQDEVDMLLLGDIDSVKINDESPGDVADFMVEHTKIPTGRWDEEYKTDALITIANMPRELGEYSGQTALKILDGTSPLDIPIVPNKKGKIFLNMKLAKQLGIIFPMDLIESAQLIPAD